MSFYNSFGKSVSETLSGYRLVTDPFTIYRNYPNQMSSLYTIDSKGFRKGYQNLEASQKAIVMGSSAAFGYAISDENLTISSKLSHIVPKYNFINAAVVGFSSGQELSQMIQYLDDCSPSLYIVINGWNDINTSARFNDKWPSDRVPLGFNSTYFEIEERLYQISRIFRPFKPRVQFEPIGDSLNKEDYFNKVIDEYLLNVEKMYVFAKARNAKFLLVLQPELSQKKYRTKEEEKMLQNWDKTYSYLDKDIPNMYLKEITKAKAYFEKKAIPFININEQPNFIENKETLFIDVVHPNERGHAIIAEIIGSYI